MVSIFQLFTLLFWCSKSVGNFSAAPCTYIYVLMIHSLTWWDLGEGGTFALYSLLAKYSNIVRRDPNTAGTVKMERHLTNDLKPMNKGVRSFIESSRAARIALKIFGVLGVSMVMVSLAEPQLRSILTPWV